MSFPSSPSNGQTATVNGISYQYNSTTNAWTRQLTQTGEKTTTSTTPPVNPGPGDAWYNPTTDVILTYMYDGANWWWIDRDGPNFGSGNYVYGNLNLSGNIVPTSNVTYNLGSPTQRFASLYLSGNTIDLGGAVIKSDATTGAIALIPTPTTANPNPTGVVVSPGGSVSTVSTVGGVLAANAISNSSNVTATSGTTLANLTVTGNIIANVHGAGLGGNLSLLSNGNVSATLDVYGNFGLGVTPSIWNDGYPGLRSIQFGNVSTSFLLSDGAGATYIGNNAYFNGSNWKYATNGNASFYSQGSTGGHSWQVAPSGTTGNTITFSPAMTLSNASGGQLGLGQATNGSWNSSVNVLQLGPSGALAYRPVNSTVTLSYNWYSNSSNQDTFIGSGYSNLFQVYNSGFVWATSGSSGSANGAISFNNVMALNNSGYLSVGPSISPSTTNLGGTFGLIAAGNSSGSGIFMGQSTATGSGSNIAQFLGVTTGTSGYQIAGGMVVGLDASSTSNASGFLQFYVGTGSGTLGSAAYINHYGYLGIGNSSPQYILDLGPVSSTQSATTGSLGIIRNSAGADSSPFTQARIIVYGGTGVDTGNWGYLAYGADASMRIVYGKTGSGAPLSFGTSTALNGTGSFTQTASLSMTGAFSASSKSFKIKHPHPDKEDTHELHYASLEGPRADIIYRGTATLAAGTATIDMDAYTGMTAGTFVILCRDVVCYTSNETDWDPVRGSVSGSTLTINCQNTNSTATVNWLVIAERQDQHMMDHELADENGRLIVEPPIDYAMNNPKLPPIIKPGQTEVGA